MFDAALGAVMPSTHAVHRPIVLPQSHKRYRATTQPASPATGPEAAVEEIQAYIAIRDGLLAEAEKAATCEALRRAAIANDLVEICLIPTHRPYEAQFLAEVDAKHERKRCAATKVRIAALGAGRR
jgi:hypothetical protein